MPTASKGKHLQIEFNKQRVFGQADINEHGMVSGWAAPEEGHVWNDGLEAIQSVEVIRQPAHAINLTVEGIPYIFGDAHKQDIALYANGSYVGFWRFTERRLAVVKACIAPECWVIRRGLAYLRLTWFMPDSMRPKDIGDGSDNRTIGFAFRSLMLAESGDGPV